MAGKRTKPKSRPALRAPVRITRDDFDPDDFEAPRRRLPAGRIFYWLIVCGLWTGVGAAVMMGYYAYTLPDTRNLANEKVTAGISFTGFDGKPLGARGDTVGEPITLRDAPAHLVNAVIATEDRRFYQHSGVDPYGLMRAMGANLMAGRLVQGGSTLTQQLAKNIFLTPERSVRRKAQELLLALWLERQFSKDEILTLYLNRVYFGSGAYGISAAANKYFGKPVNELTLPESAMLAGLLKAPSRYAPTNDIKLAKARQAQVLGNMVEANYITAEQSSAAHKMPLRVHARSDSQGSQYFFDWIVEQLPELIGRPQGDLIVATTFDVRAQAAAERALGDALTRDGARLRVTQGAVLAMAPDGAIRAMAGGRSYTQSQFNRATQARRQPGSAFKPFVYLAAMEAGLSPDTVMRDSPVILGKWSPGNFDKEFRGEISLRDALRDSINTVTVKVSERAGRQQVIEAAHRLGIVSELTPTPAVALGASEVTLLELTSAYAAFATRGISAQPYGILEVRTADGQVLYSHKQPYPRRVISERTANIMHEMLANALANGTGRAARLAHANAAGKTGTSQDNRDAWFVGYTPQLVAGIWFGNDDGAPMNAVTGGGLPARTWKLFMDEALKPQPAEYTSPFSPRQVIKPVDDLVSRFWRVLRGD